MRTRFYPALLLLLMTHSPGLSAQPASTGGEANPLLREWSTPLGVPPFQEIKPEHFLPAFKAAVDQQRREVEAIANATEPATFVNTVEALEFSGALLDKVSPVFSNLSSAETTPALQALNREVAPMLAALRDDIRLNPKLFQRISAVWEARESLKLEPAQRKLLDDTYKNFVRGGAKLDDAGKERLRQINAELATLGVKFGDNLLHDTNAFRLVIEKRDDLAGLPQGVVAAGEEAAKAAGMPGKWVYTLQAPSIWPFLDYADNRELREKIFTAYTTRGDHGDDYDNKAIVVRTIELRAERAKLLGYNTYADYVLEDNMALAPRNAQMLLRALWGPSLEMAAKESADLQEAIKADGKTFTLAPWDWRYYTEKVRKARYDLDEQSLRPYFVLDRVRDGAFAVANKLYGVTFTPRPDLPVYNAEVNAFEVKDSDGSFLGVLYTDYFPRPGKRVGGWTSRYRSVSAPAGRSIRPIVVNVCNFSRPAADMPALLSVEEVQTLFHEFGHALHSLLSRLPYSSLGTVPRDFTELPSQIMENWALEPEVLKLYAKHYKTGASIPVDLVEKMKKAEQFNQGFATVEYLAAAWLDLEWHMVKPGDKLDATEFEKATLRRIAMPPEIVVRYRSPYFNHIFGPGGGYAAGYYSYIWSEVLDADAFQAFKEKGLFDKETATSFRKNILERGALESPAELYRNFRGRDSNGDALLVRRGLKKAGTE